MVLEALPLTLLELPPPLALLNALAPKLIRRTKGDVGEEDWLGASPSSTADSSIEVPGELLLFVLFCRFRPENEELLVGEPPSARLMEVRRRCWAWALAAAVAIGPG